MLPYNYLSFYNHYTLQNTILQSNKIIKVKPRLYVAFFVKSDQKKKIIQTCELFKQFFKKRPKIVSKFNTQGKLLGFLIIINLNKRSAKRVFDTIVITRSGSRKKLITFQSISKGSQIIIKLKDFVTLYNFKIKFYDFHDWRYTLTIVDNCFSGTPLNDPAKIYCLNNFYYSFFKSPSYTNGKIKKI